MLKTKNNTIINYWMRLRTPGQRLYRHSPG